MVEWNCKHSIGAYVNAVSLTLGRQSVLQVTPPPCPRFKTPIRAASFMWLIGDSEYLWQKVLYNALSLVYMAVSNLAIKVVLIVTSYKLNFQN